MKNTPLLNVGDSYLPMFKNVHRGKFIMFEGPRGTSKTTAILEYLVASALENAGLRILLARSTRTRLTQSVLVTLEQQVFPRFGMSVPGGQHREGRSEYRLHNGSSLVTMGLDDPLRSTSAEYGLIYVAEAIEIPKREHVEVLAGSLRQARLPSWNPDFVHHCFVDCNPGPPRHWLNSEACEAVDPSLRFVSSLEDYRRVVAHNWAPVTQIDPKTGLPKWKRIITRHQDNPYYFDVRNWKYTPAGYDYVQQTLSGLSGHLRARWLNGIWAAAEGIVFPEFMEGVHVVDDFDFPTMDWYSVVGVDPGYDHPCAVLWIGHAENGVLYVFDELYLTQKGVPEVADLIKRKNNDNSYMIRRNLADPQHAFRKTMDSPTPIASQFKNNGLTFSPWPRSTDKEAMVENFRERLVNKRVKILRRCVNTIGELQSWSFKRNTKGEQLHGDDQYEDANNHAIDVVLGVNAMNLKWDGKYESHDALKNMRDRTNPMANPRTFKKVGTVWVPM